MKYGDKQVRYAVIEKDGHLREVKKTFYESTIGVDHQTKQPKSLVKIKNNGSTANDIKITGIQTKGSFIVKNDTSHYVSDFGWVNTEEVSPNKDTKIIYTSEVSIPNNETIATHGLTSDRLENIVNGTNGQFEVTDWSNCKDTELGSAFRSATCIKKVPPEWPENNITSLYRTLAGITIDTIPNWTNTTNVTDIREMLNGTTINEDLKIDGMISNLTSVTQVKKLFNNCTINKYSYTGGDYKFYSLYTALAKHNNITGNTAACFGGVQYNEKTDVYTDSYGYAVRFKYTDSDGQTANVIPPDLMYIPKEWGGFAHRAYAYVSINDSSFSNIGLSITDSHVNWGLGSYKTLKYSNNNWVISSYRDFYTSVRGVVECINENTLDKKYVLISGSSNNISWPETLDTSATYTIKIHVYTNKPDSEVEPKIVDNKIVTDWLECFVEETIVDPEDAEKRIPNPYRGEDGVYTRTGQVPFDATAYDITKCTITGNPLSQGTTEIPWKVYDEYGNRVDNGTNPPDNYVVSLSDGTNTYTFGEGTVLVTSAIIPIYSIPEGMCTDSDGNVITDIPDGDYYIDITAYKNSESCNVVSQVTVENWVDYALGVDIIPDMEAAAEAKFKWTVEKDGKSVMKSYKNADFWTWKYNDETGEWDGYNTGVANPTTDTIIDLSGEKHPDGKYRISMRVRSNYGQYSVYPTKKSSEGNFFVWEITKSSAIVYSTGERGVFIPVTFKQDTVITNYSVLTSNNNQGAPGAAIFDEHGFMLSKSSSLSGGAESREITVNDGTETTKIGYIWTATPTNTITCRANKTYYFIIAPYSWGINNTVYKYYNKSNHAYIVPSSVAPSDSVFSRTQVLPITTDYVYCGESATKPENPVEKGMYIDTVSNYHLKWGSTSEYRNGMCYVYYENGTYTYLCNPDGSEYNGYVTQYINNSYKTTDKYYIEINGEIS